MAQAHLSDERVCGLKELCDVIMLIVIDADAPVISKVATMSGSRFAACSSMPDGMFNLARSRKVYKSISHTCTAAFAGGSTARWETR